MWNFTSNSSVRKLFFAVPICLSLVILFHQIPNNASLEEIQLGRLSSMYNNCRYFHYSRQRPAARFYVDERHKLLFCYIPKVASTNLKRLILILSGTVDSKNFSSVSRHLVHEGNPMRKIQPENDGELVLSGLSEYKKFLFVRHPIERLVSAYYSKFARGNRTDNDPDPINRDTTEYLQMIGTNIIKKYRKNATALSLEKGHDVTVSEFVTYVIDETFGFENDLDEHWRSQVDICHPCSIKYDYIGKFETLHQDIDYLLHKLGEDELVQYFKSNRPYSTSSLVQKFMDQLTPRQISDLYHIYEEDFITFSYKPSTNMKLE